mgnify:FL=1
MKKNYLAIDTTTEACSVALSCDGNNQSRYTEEPRKHADLVLPMVDELLAEAGITLNHLDGIAFCQGPGAFTGLRIGAGVVQGLAFSADVPVLGVSTLATMAQRTYREHDALHVYAAIDARMGEIYWGCYSLSKNVMLLKGEESVVEPHSLTVSSVLNNKGKWVGCGTGWVFNEALESVGIQVSEIYDKMLPHAVDALTLAIPELDAGNGVSAEFALPHYVRNNVAKKKAEQG